MTLQPFVQQAEGVVGALIDSNPVVGDIFKSALQDSGLISKDAGIEGLMPQNVTLSDGLSLVDNIIPEDNKEILNFWNAFKNGYTNSGD